MPQYSDGTIIHKAEWDRLLQTIPATYTVWKDGTQAIAESNLKGGTDYTTGTDAAVIQNAVDASPATGGKIVLNSPTFNLYNWIDLKNLNNCIIDGLGVTTLKLQSDAIAAFNNSTNAATNGVTIKDLTIDGNSKNSICIALNNNATNYRLSNLYIKNGGHHLIYAGAAYGLTLDNNLFDNSGLVVGADAVAIGGEDILVQGNTFLKSAGSLGGACLTSGSMKRARILGNNFKISALCYASISLENFYDVFEDVVISQNVTRSTTCTLTQTGNIAIGNSTDHLFERAIVTDNIIEGGGITANNVEGLTIKGNQTKDSLYGILAANSKHIVISENIVKNTALTGPGGDNGGICLSTPQTATITGNLIIDTQAGAARTTPYGIDGGDGSYSLIADNRVENCGWCYGPANGMGIRVWVGATRNVIANNLVKDNNGWGIQLDTGSIENLVHGNFMCNNVTGSLGDSGTGTRKRDNYDESGLVAET